MIYFLQLGTIERINSQKIMDEVQFRFLQGFQQEQNLLYLRRRLGVLILGHQIVQDIIETDIQ